MKMQASQPGFSLLELLVVIVLLGIMASGAGLLITKPIEAYEAQVRRQQLVDQGEMALRQIARDVRRALPNSIRTSAVGLGTAVEMINTVDGARYRDEIGGTDYIAAIHVLDFAAVDDEFNFLGSLNSVTAADFAGGGLRIVIYNTSPMNIYTEAVDVADYQGIITRGDMTLALSTSNPGPDDDEGHIVMSPNFKFTQQSPGQRAFIVDGSISYICDPGTNQILRYIGYGYRAAQPTLQLDFGVAPGTVISQLNGCNISYAAGTSERGGILTIEITVTDSGESVNLLHQVHVVNVP